MLTWLIERRVVLDQVDRFVVAEPDPGAVDRRLDHIRSQLPSDADLELILDRVGLAPDDLRQLVVDNIRRDAYLADRFEVVAGRAPGGGHWRLGGRSCASGPGQAGVERSEPSWQSELTTLAGSGADAGEGQADLDYVKSGVAHDHRHDAASHEVDDSPHCAE